MGLGWFYNNRVYGLSGIEAFPGYDQARRVQYKYFRGTLSYRYHDLESGDDFDLGTGNLEMYSGYRDMSFDEYGNRHARKRAVNHQPDEFGQFSPHARSSGDYVPPLMHGNIQLSTLL